MVEDCYLFDYFYHKKQLTTDQVLCSLPVSYPAAEHYRREDMSAFNRPRWSSFTSAYIEMFLDCWSGKAIWTLLQDLGTCDCYNFLTFYRLLYYTYILGISASFSLWTINQWAGVLLNSRPSTYTIFFLGLTDLAWISHFYLGKSVNASALHCLDAFLLTNNSQTVKSECCQRLN